MSSVLFWKRGYFKGQGENWSGRAGEGAQASLTLHGILTFAIPFVWAVLNKIE
jgi:hypothetical protein